MVHTGNLLERDETGRVGGTDTRSTVLDRLAVEIVSIKSKTVQPTEMIIWSSFAPFKNFSFKKRSRRDKRKMPTM